ncbi:poly-gamma-glutamate biosynthesis (capsule formation)-like protein [Komagataeibacter diospyri]|uniref:CapA family protein n=1 Tax=Komagataeibacter diospyri TaxID=1932662 RepID=UPI001138656F|nr:CapA family protein [Komagataeibacter diospyri]GCE88530.1 poly-gamma-glutamate biosynthesis (capsule formation)-like protein [Komagataeibacter diospyri]
MKVCLTGDSIVLRRLNTDVDPVCMKLFDMIRDCDASFTNLEIMPSDYQGDPGLDHGGSHFSAHPWILDELQVAGFDLFAAATNHCLDYSISGLRRAISELNLREILYAGVGLTLEEARRPAYYSHPNGTVGMLSCCSTFARGQEAADQTRSMQGRPGLNPLHFTTTYQVRSEELKMLRSISTGLGLEKIKEEQIRLGFGYPAPEGTLTLDGTRFVEGPDTRILTTPSPRDLEEIGRWVREARVVSDVVIVSVHTHEVGYDENGNISWEKPGAFLETFAHDVIDQGADIVVCHGQHLLKGMEMYKGKPIFYSLGNFIGQNELVDMLPEDSYTFYKVSTDVTPHQVYKTRTQNDTKGFPADRRFWETLLPVCEFDGDGRLSSMEIHPVSLGLGKSAHRRGLPFLAQGREGQEILERFAELCRPYGTTFRSEGGKLVLEQG